MIVRITDFYLIIIALISFLFYNYNNNLLK